MALSPQVCFSDLIKIKLKNEFITIRVATENDLPELEKIFEPIFLQWFISKYENCAQFIHEKLNKQSQEKSVTFVIEENKTKKIIGTTSLYELKLKHRRLEMGSTWYGKDFVGKGFNAMTKLLVLEYLFETLGIHRVQWNTDSRNLAAQNSMLKMGFHLDGTLPYHVITYTNHVRDTLVFSVVKPQWHQVKEILKKRINEKK